MPQRVRPVNSFMISFSSLYHDNDQKTARLALIGLLWLLVKSKNRKARYQVPGKKPEGGGGGGGGYNCLYGKKPRFQSPGI